MDIDRSRVEARRLGPLSSCQAKERSAGAGGLEWLIRDSPFRRTGVTSRATARSGRHWASQAIYGEPPQQSCYRLEWCLGRPAREHGRVHKRAIELRQIDRAS